MNENESLIMEKLHCAQFALLNEFDRVCRNHDLKYYLAAGTLLGAVRHSDFIPWDDDVDVYLKRKDYEKFLQYKDEFEFPFELHVPSDKDTYFWDYTTRLVYKKSQLKFNKSENEFYNHTDNEYLFLDIFVLDKARGGLRNTLQLAGLKIVYGLAMSRRYAIDYSEYKGVLSKCQVFVLSHLGKLFQMKTLFRMYNNISVKYNSDLKAMYEQPTNITVKFLGKLFYKKEWHSKTVRMPIRKKDFLCPEAYEEILKSIYGDYMSLPPEKDRKPDHVDVLEKIRIN